MLGPRFNKACDSCHISKVRCVPDGDAMGSTCKRCTRNGTACVFSPVGPRRRPMRTKNERMAELERRVRDMQLKLEIQVEKRALGSGSQLGDVLERGLVTPAQADRLVCEFRSHLHGKYLSICLPAGLASHDQLRRKHPAFWLSVLCAASASSLDFLPLAPMLFAELKQVLDARIVPGAEPDLDALQALINYVSFHHDPVFPLGKQVLHIYRTAVAMVVQMAEASPLHKVPPDTPLADQDLTDDHVLLSRELLHWYWASFSLSIKSRQSSMLTKTNLVEASLRILQLVGAQHDMFLTEWIKMVRIGADTALDLHRGHTQGADGLSDEARDDILSTFEKRRKQWLVECPFHLVNEILMLEYHYHVLLISEVVYPAGVADFRQRSQGLPPISPRSQASCSPSSSPSTPSQPNTAPSSSTNPDRNFLAPYKLPYTRKCITAAHACLDLVTNPPPSSSYTAASSHYSSSPPSSSLSFSSSSNSLRSSSSDLLRRFGVVPYGRIFYALRFLLFLAHEVWKTGRYDLVDVGSLRIGSYIASLKKCLNIASAGGRYRTPELWLYALRTRIEPWYRDLCALLEDSRAGTAAGEEDDGQGEETPRAGSEPLGPGVGASQASTSPSGIPTTDTTTSSRALAQEVDDVRSPGVGGGGFFSPLLFDFPFEVLSTGGTSNPPLALSNPKNARDRTKRTASPPRNHVKTPKGQQPLPVLSTFPIPRTSKIPPQPPPAPPLQTSNRLLQGLGNNNPTQSDLSASFEDIGIYNSPLDLTLGDFGQILPGPDLFLAPLQPLATETPQSEMFGSDPGSPPLHTQGHGDGGTKER